MSRPKNSPKFEKYANKNLNRHDRLDPEWHATIDTVEEKKEISYRAKKSQNRTIDLSKSVERMHNDVYSKYPIRLSL